MAGPLRTQVELPTLDAAQNKRLKQLEEELRCLVCQNQNLADSNAELAGDLRNIVHRMIADNHSDQAIKDFLVERYGDFVLYDPPVQRNTWVLWGGPFLMLGLGAGVWTIIQRRQRRALAASANAAPIDGSARERARALLADTNADSPADDPRASR
ncbi:MAG: cytochrome c-type biogenesis protein [Burkholderiaceae bacterium]